MINYTRKENAFTKGFYMFRMKILAVIAAFAVGMTAVSGCSGSSVRAGLTSITSTTASQSETTTSVTSAASRQTDKTEETAETSASAAVTEDTVKTKRAALKTAEYTCAFGTTYLGEIENQAAMEVVLAELGVDESLLKDPSRLLDFGGSDIWMLCFSDDVKSLKVTVGEDENGNGKELFKAEKGSIPDYLFIRCFSSGEMASCTVYAEGEVSGITVYYPVMIGGQIVIPNGGGVLNQSEGYETYIDVPGETDDTDNTDNKEEEEP